VVNPGQRDEDLDGYGTDCDSDLNQDCISGAVDVGLVSSKWLFGGPPWDANPNGAAVGTIQAYDLNGDNVIGAVDVGIISGNWLGPQGPSGYACAGWCTGIVQNFGAPVTCP
jgi:hypothetical protein